MISVICTQVHHRCMVGFLLRMVPEWAVLVPEWAVLTSTCVQAHCISIRRDAAVLYRHTYSRNL